MSKITKPMTYAFLLVIVVTAVFLISNFGTELLNNDKASLSNDSIVYISELSGEGKRVGINTSFVSEDLDNPNADESGDNKNEFSLDFNFGKKQANTVSRFLYIVTSIPEVIIKDIFRLTDLQWFVDILDWFWRFAIFIAIYYLIRGIGQ
jgi:hypothetical protein